MLDLDCPLFEPHPWLRGPHAQTLATRLPRRSLVRRAPLDEARAIRVDSTSEVLALCRWQAERRRAPLALLLHGLTGDASADYMLGVAEKLTLAGFSTARMNMRGCGGTEALARSIYHAGLTEDVATVARELREREQIERVYLVGCSLGGGMMLRWLGELGASVPDWLRGAAVVSPAIDLAASQRRLDSDPRCRMYREFDNRYTGPLSRYGSAERYYGEASALPVVDAIRRPTLVIAAQDDPFIPFDSFRDARLQENAWLQLLAPANGGHVAFIAERAAAHRAWCDVDRHWAENRVAQFLHHLEEGARRSYHRSA
jgi:predicted alpha/beta-fold hydrolase